MRHHHAAAHARRVRPRSSIKIHIPRQCSSMEARACVPTGNVATPRMPAIRKPAAVQGGWTRPHHMVLWLGEKMTTSTHRCTTTSSTFVRAWHRQRMSCGRVMMLWKGEHDMSRACMLAGWLARSHMRTHTHMQRMHAYSHVTVTAEGMPRWGTMHARACVHPCMWRRPTTTRPVHAMCMRACMPVPLPHIHLP